MLIIENLENAGKYGKKTKSGLCPLIQNCDSLPKVFLYVHVDFTKLIML